LATLRAAGVHPVVMVSGVDESVVRLSDPAEFVSELARLKAHAVVDRLAAQPDPDSAAPDGSAVDGSAVDGPAVDGAESDGWVLGCDSVLAIDGEILGRPVDAADAVRRWHRMSGRSGVLHTGHCLVDLTWGTEVLRAVATTVHFARLGTDEIEAYVATGEPLEVAGAFTVDGIGGAFVTHVEGDHHNVVGLSLPTLREMFADLDVAWPSLWNR
jgi:septum formation protein